MCNGSKCKVCSNGVREYGDGLRRIDRGVCQRDSKIGLRQSDGCISAECHHGYGDDRLTNVKISDAFTQCTDCASDPNARHKWWGWKARVISKVAATEEHIDHSHGGMSNVDGDLSGRWSRIRQRNVFEHIGRTKTRNRHSTHQFFLSVALFK